MLIPRQRSLVLSPSSLKCRSILPSCMIGVSPLPVNLILPPHTSLIFHSPQVTIFQCLKFLYGFPLRIRFKNKNTLLLLPCYSHLFDPDPTSSLLSYTNTWNPCSAWNWANLNSQIYSITASLSLWYFLWNSFLSFPKIFYYFKSASNAIFLIQPLSRAS